MSSVDALPEDAESLKRLLLAREAELAAATAEAATLRAKAADDQALIAHLKLQIEKMKRISSGRARSAVHGCSTSSSFDWRIWSADSDGRRPALPE